MHRAICFAILTPAFWVSNAGPALAKDNNQVMQTPATYQAVLDCKSIADPSARLACYDQKVSTLAAAVRDHQLVIADRETVREARRGLFGLSLPRLKLFGGDGDSEEVQQIESTIKAVRSASDGMPIFVLADESRWKQTDGRTLFAKAGGKIKVKRTAMGGYMANVDGQTGVRVVRLAN